MAFATFVVVLYNIATCSLKVHETKEHLEENEYDLWPLFTLIEVEENGGVLELVNLNVAVASLTISISLCLLTCGMSSTKSILRRIEEEEEGEEEEEEEEEIFNLFKASKMMDAAEKINSSYLFIQFGFFEIASDVLFLSTKQVAEFTLVLFCIDIGVTALHVLYSMYTLQIGLKELEKGSQEQAEALKSHWETLEGRERATERMDELAKTQALPKIRGKHFWKNIVIGLVLLCFGFFWLFFGVLALVCFFSCCISFCVSCCGSSENEGDSAALAFNIQLEALENQLEIARNQESSLD